MDLLFKIALYLFVGIFILILSQLKSRKKKKAKVDARRRSNPAYHAQNDVKNDYQNELNRPLDIYDEKSFKEGSPQTFSTNDKIIHHKKTTNNRPAGSSLEKKKQNSYPISGKHNASFLQIDKKNKRELKRAVIYSEILKRKY